MALGYDPGVFFTDTTLVTLIGHDVVLSSSSFQALGADVLARVRREHAAFEDKVGRILGDFVGDLGEVIGGGRGEEL